MFTLWVYLLRDVGTRVLVCSFQRGILRRDDEENLMVLSLSSLKCILNGKSLLGIRIMAAGAAVLNASSPESTWEEKTIRGIFFHKRPAGTELPESFPHFTSQ